jgi:hypothetical protein
MTISATERDELRGLALQVFGERGADLLMAGLASAGMEAMEERIALRIDLVRSDLRIEIGELRGELAEFRGDVRGEFGELRGEIGELRGEFGELKGQFGELQGYIGTELGEVRKEMGAIRGEIGTQNRLFLFSIIASFVGVASIVFGALQVAG